ncbi:unnamed protein product [Aureobasidium vineae]|uniref:BTB domain-containing protein n=1 Tax=Aureobasidium vineae TaxID=2773715 RepID=A0A9N8JFU8_9PEZI|nr:unnamed protein product [Aureobasidium vineae]
MTLKITTGSERAADVRLVTSDGFVIPFHTLILEYGWLKLKDLLSFIYEGTYQDEDKTLTFPRVEPPASPSSVNRLSDTPLEYQEAALTQGLHNLHLTSQPCKSVTLLKALASVKVYRAAITWDIDRLMIEAAHRFGNFISGSFDKDDFPQFVNAVFKSVVDSDGLLYGHLVEECFSHCQDLVENKVFLTVLEHNGKLAVLLYRRLARLQASTNGTLYMLPHTSSASGPSNSASVVDSSAVANVQAQLTEALDAVSARQKRIEALEQEAARLKETVTEAQDAASSKQKQIDVLEQEAAQAKGQKTPLTNLEGQVQKLMMQKVNKDTVIDNLEHQLEQQERKNVELGHTLTNANERNAELVRQINSQRIGQPDNTMHILERKEAIENSEKLQARLTASEDKIKELEAQLAAHVQQSIIAAPVFVPQSVTNCAAQPSRPQQPTQPPQDAGPKRKIEGFGEMNGTMDTIAKLSSTAPAARPPSPLPTPPVPTAPTMITQTGTSGGVMTFADRIARSRRIAAGLQGGDQESASSSEVPPRMTVAPCGPPSAIEQPMRSPSVAPSTSSTVAGSAPSVNGAPRGPHAAALARGGGGPHSRLTKGGPHAASRTSVAAASAQTNGTSQHNARQENATAAVPVVPPSTTHTAGPAGSTAASARDPSADPATTTNGEVSASPDERDSLIQRLTSHNSFLRAQLNDARAGPASNIQSQGRGGFGPPSNGRPSGGGDRLERVLKALKEYALDHKSCNDCSINFNSQFRGMVDNINDPDLILMCSKCGNEKCRWRC